MHDPFVTSRTIDEKQVPLSVELARCRETVSTLHAECERLNQAPGDAHRSTSSSATTATTAVAT